MPESSGCLVLEGMAAELGGGGCRGAGIGQIRETPCAARHAGDRVVPPPRDPYRRPRMGKGAPYFPYTDFGGPRPLPMLNNTAESLVPQWIAAKITVTATPTKSAVYPTNTLQHPLQAESHHA